MLELTMPEIKQLSLSVLFEIAEKTCKLQCSLSIEKVIVMSLCDLPC